MFASVYGMTAEGLSAQLVRVEVDVSNGLPGFEIVGLPATAVKEARDRVRSALRNSGFQVPLKRITVNLAPADLRKEGSGLDLSIAVGILTAMGEVDSRMAEGFVFVGELSLEGSLRPVPGILTMAVNLSKLKASGAETGVRLQGSQEGMILVVPPGNLAEARLVPDLETQSAADLGELSRILQHKQEFTGEPITEADTNQGKNLLDWSDIRGQNQAKRALEIAASGGHNLMMIGSPGSGKTLLARSLAGILPSLTAEESLEVTQLYSSAGLLKNHGQLIKTRPFRCPHHTATVAGMIGGGQKIKLGELPLANHGVLFLDELPEFSREVLEALRQPLEDRKMTLIRLRGRMEFSARISVIGAMNPCPCGYLGDQFRECTCTPLQVSYYRRKISGPLLDRFDLQIEVPRLSYDELRQQEKPESSEAVRERVAKTREIQWQRFGSTKTNAEMTARETKEVCILDSTGEALLKKVFDQRLFSARAYDRILRVARTIADMDGSEEIRVGHLAESLQYKVLDQEQRFG